MSNKYGAVKTTVDGITFDSKMEAKFYKLLEELIHNNEIKGYKRQVKFVVHDGYVKNGKKIRPITYVADFVIDHLDGETEIVDVKGFTTEVFNIKKKLFEKKYPSLTINCVTYSKIDGGWIALEDLKRARKKRKLVRNGGANESKRTR